MTDLPITFASSLKEQHENTPHKHIFKIGDNYAAMAKQGDGSVGSGSASSFIARTYEDVEKAIEYARINRKWPDGHPIPF